MMLLPIVLRLMARFEGIPRFTGLELSLMTRYFIFQVVVCTTLFLVVFALTLVPALVFDYHHFVGYHCRSSPTRFEPYFHSNYSCSEAP